MLSAVTISPSSADQRGRFAAFDLVHGFFDGSDGGGDQVVVEVAEVDFLHALGSFPAADHDTANFGNWQIRPL